MTTHSTAVMVMLSCASPRADGSPCGSQYMRARFDSTADPFAEARSQGWTFRDVARCPACGRAGAKFGKIITEAAK